MHQHGRRLARERGASSRPQKLAPSHAWYSAANWYRSKSAKEVSRKGVKTQRITRIILCVNRDRPRLVGSSESVQELTTADNL